jgi:DNA-binding NarL/FixJ family response regulator
MPYRKANLKILVVDDHPLVREAMSGMLRELADDLALVEANDCASGLAAAQSNADLDLVLLDLNLPGTRGFDALDRFRREQPTLPVVILSMHHDRDTVLEAMRRGAAGFIPKASPKPVVLNAIRLILSGSPFVPAEAIAANHEKPFDPSEFAPPTRRVASVGEIGLTERQGQVLALLMRGKSNKEICRALGLAERTVKVHVTAVLTALKVTSRTQAVIAAGQLGLSADALLAVEPKGDG